MTPEECVVDSKACPASSCTSRRLPPASMIYLATRVTKVRRPERDEAAAAQCELCPLLPNSDRIIASQRNVAMGPQPGT